MDPAPSPGPVLLVHTGAWNVPEAEKVDHRQGARRAVEAAVMSMAVDLAEPVVAGIRPGRSPSG
ncbi:MAG: hypothetical protein ACC662_07960 [Planctomycetota bacterium]